MKKISARYEEWKIHNEDKSKKAKVLDASDKKELPELSFRQFYNFSDC